MNKNLLKKGLFIIFTLLFMFSLCSCENNLSKSNKISFNLTNTVEDRLSSVTVSWYIDGVDTGNSDIKFAGGDETLGKDTFSFFLNKDDVVDESVLEQLSIVISVTDSTGKIFNIPALDLPSNFGDEYNYELKYKEGNYFINDGSSN